MNKSVIRRAAIVVAAASTTALVLAGCGGGGCGTASPSTDANAKVTLTGLASTPAEKSAATKIARDVRGVKSVDNQIDIKVN